MYLILFTLRYNIKVEKLSSNKINGTKKCSFFLFPAPTYHSFTFNLQFLHELKHKVRFSKIVCGIFHSRFRFVFIKFYVFVQQNGWSFVARPLIFKLQQEFLKFSVSWSSPKTDLVTHFLNLENRTLPVFLSSTF